MDHQTDEHKRQSHLNAVHRLNIELIKKGPYIHGVKRGQNVETTTVLVLVDQTGNAVSATGRFILGDHWNQLLVMNKKFFPPQPEVRLRMRDLRAMGFSPEHASKLVLENYYKQG